MTVETTANTVSYVGNGATTVFPFAFQIPAESDLFVSVNGIVQSPSTYTATGIGSETGGSVTYPVSGTPLAASQTITITRTLPLTQTMDLTNQDGFYPETVEEGMDRLEMQIQQINTAEVNTAQGLEDAINLFESLINTTTNQALFNTRNAAAAATISAGVGFVRTAGNASVGDNGDALYARDTVSTPGAFQSVDGAWWRLVSRPLKLTMFPGMDSTGLTSSTAAADLMKALAVQDEEIHVPAGNWLFSTPVATRVDNVTWIIDDGAQMTLASSANLLTNYQNANRIGGTQVYHSEKHGRSNTDTQETFEYTSFTVQSANGLVDHEKETQFVLIVTDDDEQESGSPVYKAAVAATHRAYIASTNPNGRAFALNPYVLIEPGGFGVLNAMEADVSHNSHEQPSPFTDDVKISISAANVGPVPISASFLVVGNESWNGFIAARASIKNDVAARSFVLQDVFGIDRDGYATFGKDVHDRDVIGVELTADGQIWQTETGTATLIQTRRGTPGTGTLCQILGQQKNNSGTLKTFSNYVTSVSNAGAGTETTVVSIDALNAGAAVTLSIISGSRYSSGLDNAVTCGHPAARWSEVFAVNPVINTSDAREKSEPLPIDDKVLDAWGRVVAKQFQWLDSIEKKGKEKARIHVGWIWQEIEKAFEAEGLDPRRYGLFCEDPIIERVLVKKMIPQKVGTKEVPVLDASGKPIFDKMKKEIWKDGNRVFETIVVKDKAGKEQEIRKPKHELVPVPRTRPEEIWEDRLTEVFEDQPTGEMRGGLRNEQCLMIESMWHRRETTRLAARVRMLEGHSPAQPSTSPTGT